MTRQISAPICSWCGDEAVAEVLEAWGHEFMLDTCCEGMHRALSHELAEGGRDAAAVLRSLGIEGLLARTLRGVDAGGPGLALDFNLEIRPVRFGICKSFVEKHHHHCRPPAGWRFGAGCFNGPTLVGVVMVGRPVARMIDATTIVEVNRLCIDRDLSSALRRNAASKLLGHAAREAKRRGFFRIITYTLESEGGGSLRAAGWLEDGRSPGGGWSRPSRARAESGPTEPKVRWARDLRGRQQAKGRLPA